MHNFLPFAVGLFFGLFIASIAFIALKPGDDPSRRAPGPADPTSAGGEHCDCCALPERSGLEIDESPGKRSGLKTGERERERESGRFVDGHRSYPGQNSGRTGEKFGKLCWDLTRCGDGPSLERPSPEQYTHRLDLDQAFKCPAQPSLDETGDDAAKRLGDETGDGPEKSTPERHPEKVPAEMRPGDELVYYRCEQDMGCVGLFRIQDETRKEHGLRLFCPVCQKPDYMKEVV